MMLRFLAPSPSPSSTVLARVRTTKTTLHAPMYRTACVSLPSSTRVATSTTTAEKLMEKMSTTDNDHGFEKLTTDEPSVVISELYAIAEVVVDRVEMHANIGEQRNNWNNLLLTSINSITLTASLMAGLSSVSSSQTPILGLKLSSTLLYTAATLMLLVVNKIQPSQLAEEQRNAARLFRQLHEKIKSTLALHKSPTSMDVKDAMERVLAIDKAYPLPLLGGVMLNKFPKTIEPAVWWPKESDQQHGSDKSLEKNGWSGELEEEMRKIVGVLKRNDSTEYARLSKRVLKLNRTLSILGPLFTGLGALGSVLLGSSSHQFGTWALVAAIVGGAMASVVNTLEHGGQIGMVFEMYRNCAGFYRFVEDSIESSLKESELEKRENGELFEIKVALELGRSLSELRDLASKASSSSSSSSSSSLNDEDDGNGSSQFAGKLF